MMPKKILIVDDHPIVRQGLSQLIEQEPDLDICGEKENVLDAVEAIVELKPDIVIVDLSLKNSNGLELIQTMKKRFPNLPALVLSMHEESIYAERALRAGARGYIMKQEAINNVVNAIRKILQGGIYVSENIGNKIMMGISGQSDTQGKTAVDLLSNRELEVFRLIGKALKPLQIAERLNLSVKTVETYRLRIKQKLNLKSSNELTQYAIEWEHSKVST